MIKKTKYAYIVFWVLIFGIIQEMPSAVEGYFWYGGAIGYTFLHSFYFCLVGVLIRVENERNKNIVRGILISIGAFFMGGSHYITALECAILFFLYIGFSLINKKNHLLVEMVGYGSVLYWIFCSDYGTGQCSKTGGNCGYANN